MDYINNLLSLQYKVCRREKLKDYNESSKQKENSNYA